MAVDAFLNLTGISGESMDSKFAGAIEIASWSFGAEQTGGFSYGGGGGAGKVSVHDFKVTKKVDKASPKLFAACADGSHIKEAKLTLRKAGKTALEYMVITMSDLLVSKTEWTGKFDGDEVPMEDVSMNFSKVTIEYKEQKADGSAGPSTKAGWDLKLNKAAA